MSPDAIQLTFADNLLMIKGHSANSVSVIDPMDQNIAVGTGKVNGAVLSAEIHPTMRMDGTYTVNFRVVAQDGHVV
jgi:methionine-rich copper-binding protein CopC